MKILVAEPLAPAAMDALRAQPSWDIVEADPKTFQSHLADSDALLVRSAVKITSEVLAKAPKLKIIGRAGVGVDNVDLNAATNAGVLVMNTPGGNAVSVAEHTLALMLSMARSVPQASISTKSGKWEKKKFLGNELRGKTLGVVGLGSIGREVLKRAKAFEMQVIAHDPYVSSHTAHDLSVDLLPLQELYSKSDYITLHVALTPETDHMLNAEAFGQMKAGVRIINCARGELIDTSALRDAVERGSVSGVAMDVFEKEPPGEDPLLKLDAVVATPHIAGSTEEAQEIVGIRIAEQLIEYLKTGVALNAVNMPALTAEQYRALGPYINLGERLGTFLSHIAVGNPHTVRFVYLGRLADHNTQILRNAGLAGVLSRSMEHRANMVNAMQIATERGFRVVEQREPGRSHMDSIRIELESDAGVFSVVGAIVLDKPRLLQVEGISCEATLDGNLIFSKSEDVPGVIGYLGTVLGRNGINIANFALGREDVAAETEGNKNEPLTAISIVETDEPVTDPVISQLFENKAFKFVRRVTFTR
ncbi:MAG: phosphoglycerate dehydrogenase [Acidobacteriaceae bacterium]|nr:phosphoglycerate dehydrogenase [Acidobacteriaceae bacterium]MBV9779665.1 phosphoglycerate dehydrogenase [Acidobacteriaceae bacterium]